MASFLYNNFLDHCLGKGAAVGTRPDLDTDAIRVGIASGADYTESAAHDTWDDVGAYTLNACYNSEATQILSNKTITDGVFDNTADITFTSVSTTGNNVDALVHYLATGVIGDDTLLCFHDGFTPVTPNGGDIVVQYHASGIFSL